eukprot:s3768_g3.t1
MSPHGLEELISAMRATVLPEPYEDFATTWAKVGAHLRDARLLATVRDRRVLARLEALLVVGEWHATASNLPPHPKLPGYCLVTAKDSLVEVSWTYLVGCDDCFERSCVAARKVLSTLAWHCSMRANLRREFVWTRRAAELAQGMVRKWRHERKGTYVVRRKVSPCPRSDRDGPPQTAACGDHSDLSARA